MVARSARTNEQTDGQPENKMPSPTLTGGKGNSIWGNTLLFREIPPISSYGRNSKLRYCRYGTAFSYGRNSNNDVVPRGRTRR